MNNVISTKVIVFRNVKDYKFTRKLTDQEKEEIISKVALTFEDFQKINLNNENEGMFNYIQTADLKCGDYPVMLVSKSERIAVNFFNSEHLSIVATGYGFNTTLFEKIEIVLRNLSSKVSLSYQDDYGYLMSDLSKVGAGIVLECNICLSAINKLGKIEQVRQNMKKLGYQLKNSKIKNIYTLSTTCNLGFSAKEIYSDFSKIVEKLQSLEIESAKMQDVENHDEMMDTVMRSLAILQSAHMMGIDELIERINDIRLGVNIGLIDLSQTKMQALNELIQVQHNEFVSKSELIALSDKVKTILKGE